MVRLIHRHNMLFYMSVDCSYININIILLLKYFLGAWSLAAVTNTYCGQVSLDVAGIWMGDHPGSLRRNLSLHTTTHFSPTNNNLHANSMAHVAIIQNIKKIFFRYANILHLVLYKFN